MEVRQDGVFAAKITPGKTYNPMGLYLAGLIPADEVPDFWVAEDGEWLRDDDGNVGKDANGYWNMATGGRATIAVSGLSQLQKR